LKIEKLILKDGIIQNKTIGDIPVKINIIDPKGKSNVRTLVKLYSEDGCTIHNTGNESPTAGDEMHAKYFQNVEDDDKQYVGAQLFVDHDSITQIAPLDEKMYHAGDGKFGPGNTTTFGLEICVNKFIEKAHSNAKVFLAAYLLAYPDKKLFGHIDWSGKYCPSWILTHGGLDDFYADVYCLVESQKDLFDVSDWAIKGFNYVTSTKLSDGTRPKENLTREEFWTVLERMRKI